MKYWKAVKKIKQNTFQTGGIGGSQKTTFKIGETYQVSGEPGLCKNGFHFYKASNFVFGAVLFGDQTVFLEIEPLSEVISDTEKCVCTKIKILRYVPKKEWKKLIKKNLNTGDLNSGIDNSGNRNSGHLNTGICNSGDCNSGDCNSGDLNSGDCNSGYRNSGHWNSGNRNTGNRNTGNCNSGHCNSGDCNSGYRNSGYRNSGDCNSGNRNSGDLNSGHRNSGDYNSGNRNTGYRNSGYRNSGDWNSGDFNSGHFNRDTPKTINVFEKPCLRSEWEKAIKPRFLFFDIKENETYQEAFQRSWKKATDEDRKLIESLPNFNWEIFTQISGIKNPNKN